VTEAFPFLGRRCERITEHVMARLATPAAPNNSASDVKTVNSPSAESKKGKS
jgi:hypothetical protein